MTYRSAQTTRTRLAACLAAAGLLFAAAASAQTPLPPPSVPVGADQRQDRIEELERQLREQTGENERLQHQLNEAQREITRLRGMVGELAGVNQQLSTPPPADAASPPAAGGAGPAPSSLNEAQRNATGTLGSLPASEAPAQRDPVAEYTRARTLLNNGQYAEAEAALASFLEAFPNVDTAADARFWFAFTLAARNNHADAAANFVQYLQANRNGPRAAEAQVRLGMALVQMGDTRRGCSAFTSLARQYPNASRTVRDLAAREARAANCAA
ncbi:MAG TPA: tetratricopeptide repeat protein [Vitreimonas sp.]|uniref:tetratricopeptide repeat protein n=1 Tax=Vitreimonas sp. TaxID=3069702 RepID=UPI002D6B6AAF|nr:tetratricopeptide repeat protein [Vitreimonas sp.]HYD88193.1 tetratricopeptide repeat protein [Vitreimonas sp.]